MARYKINFTGFAYVEAEDEFEAEDIFWNDGSYYEEFEVEEVELAD